MSVDPIVVAAATDESYLPFALVVAESIARTATSGRPIEFHVLYDGPDHWAAERIAAYSRGPVRGVLHRVRNTFEHLGIINGFPPSTFFRHMIPDVLAEHGRAIYLDLDVVAETDLAPLFDADLKGNAIGGVSCTATVMGALLSDGNDPKGNWRTYFRDVLGLTSDEQFLGFIQSGVLLLDLEQLRQMDFDKQMERTAIENRGRLRHAEQGTLNKLFIGQMTRLDARWNRTGAMLYPEMEHRAPPLIRDQAARQRRVPGILHFGGAKPWNAYFIRGSARWWSFALRSEARDYLLRRVFLAEKGRVYNYVDEHHHWALKAYHRLKRLVVR